METSKKDGFQSRLSLLNTSSPPSSSAEKLNVLTTSANPPSGGGGSVPPLKKLSFNVSDVPKSAPTKMPTPSSQSLVGISPRPNEDGSGSALGINSPRSVLKKTGYGSGSVTNVTSASLRKSAEMQALDHLSKSGIKDESDPSSSGHRHKHRHHHHHHHSHRRHHSAETRPSKNSNSSNPKPQTSNDAVVVVSANTPSANGGSRHRHHHNENRQTTHHHSTKEAGSTSSRLLPFFPGKAAPPNTPSSPPFTAEKPFQSISADEVKLPSATILDIYRVADDANTGNVEGTPISRSYAIPSTPITHVFLARQRKQLENAEEFKPPVTPPLTPEPVPTVPTKPPKRVLTPNEMRLRWWSRRIGAVILCNLLLIAAAIFLLVLYLNKKEQNSHRSAPKHATLSHTMTPTAFNRTLTVTYTRSNTATVSLTRPKTNTATITFPTTITVSQTSTRTSTLLPTITLTPIPTATPIPTHTSTRTPRHTITYSHTPTPSVVRTISYSPTISYACPVQAAAPDVEATCFWPDTAVAGLPCRVCWAQIAAATDACTHVAVGSYTIRNLLSPTTTRFLTVRNRCNAGCPDTKMRAGDLLDICYRCNVEEVLERGVSCGDVADKYGILAAQILNIDDKNRTCYESRQLPHDRLLVCMDPVPLPK